MFWFLLDFFNVFQLKQSDEIDIALQNVCATESAFFTKEVVQKISPISTNDSKVYGLSTMCAECQK